jgi:hypothetical protein
MKQSNGTSRNAINLALGILVGLRGYSPEEAFVELAEVVRRTGLGVGTVAPELVALASGATSTAHAGDLSAWVDLIRHNRIRPLGTAR